MEIAEFDFVVLGGGSAGYAAARTAVGLGMSTAVIDSAETLGGLCILRGCMPSKTLIESANRYRSMRRAEDFGLRAGATEVRAEEIIARKRALIGDFASYRQQQLHGGDFELIRGRAAFQDAHSLKVSLLEGGERQIKGKAFCVATGSVISRVQVPGLEETGYLASDEVLDLETLPESVIVLGGGAIALELACYFEGLGKQVTVIQRSSQLLSGGDGDLAMALEDAMAARDIRIHTGTELQRIESREGRKVVHFKRHGEPTEAEADEILYALGRWPAAGGLGLEAAGVELKGRHVSASMEMATSQPHVFAAGDVCGPSEVVHTAIAQAEIAAHNAAVLLGKTAGPKKQMDYRLDMLGVFTHPEVATVGMSEVQAKREERDILCASYPFDDHGKSMVMGETHGFVKVIADAGTGEMLGAAAVGPEAVDLIHEMAVAIHFRSSVSEFLKIPHYHPTLSEIWTYPVEEIAEVYDNSKKR